jgi:hypothetical protein
MKEIGKGETARPGRVPIRDPSEACALDKEIPLEEIAVREAPGRVLCEAIPTCPDLPRDPRGDHRRRLGSSQRSQRGAWLRIWREPVPMATRRKPAFVSTISNPDRIISEEGCTACPVALLASVRTASRSVDSCGRALPTTSARWGK